jgi:hypothetical protein
VEGVQCQWIFQQSAENPKFTAKVLFTDRLCFTRTAITNIHNEYEWSDENTNAIRSQHQQHSFPSTYGLEFQVTSRYELVVTITLIFFEHIAVGYWKMCLSIRVFEGDFNTMFHHITVVKCIYGYPKINLDCELVADISQCPDPHAKLT